MKKLNIQQKPMTKFENSAKTFCKWEIDIYKWNNSTYFFRGFYKEFQVLTNSNIENLNSILK